MVPGNSSTAPVFSYNQINKQPENLFFNYGEYFGYCFDNVILHLNQRDKIKNAVIIQNCSGKSPTFIHRRGNLLCQRKPWKKLIDVHQNSGFNQRGKTIRGLVFVVTAVNDLLIQTNRTSLQEWTFGTPCNFRRNHSNCSVIELYRTRFNLIERLGSIKFGNRTQSEPKHLRENSINFDFRTQSNQSDLIERFKPTLKIDKDWECSKQKAGN